MVFDCFRQYTLNPGGLPTYMPPWRNWPCRFATRHGVKLAGWFYSDLGDLNQGVHTLGPFDNVETHGKGPRARWPQTPSGAAHTFPVWRGVIQAQNTYLMKTQYSGVRRPVRASTRIRPPQSVV